MELVECLIKIGFTKHESMLYISLCKEGELTGYEAAKVSGIPRSNAYLALAALVDKGGAYRIDSDAIKYIPVPATELVANAKRRINKVLDTIKRNIPSKDFGEEPYITISGKSHIINKMKNMISQAKERIYLSLAPEEMVLVENELILARERNLKIVLITSHPYEMENVIVYHTEKQPGQIRIIVDTSFVLTGEISDIKESTCLYTNNKNLLQLIKDSLTNEIALIKLKYSKKLMEE